MDDRDRAEMQALCDLFRESSQRNINPPLFGEDARQRFGEMISRAARQGRPYHAYTSPRP